MYHKNYALDVQNEITASRRYFYLHAGTSESNITFESSGSEILKGISAATIQMVILSSGLPLKLKLRLYLTILSSGAVYCKLHSTQMLTSGLVKLTSVRPQNKTTVPFKGFFQNIRRTPLSLLYGIAPPPPPLPSGFRVSRMKS